MSANAQTITSTEAGPTPPAVAAITNGSNGKKENANANGEKKKNNNGNNNPNPPKKNEPKNGEDPKETNRKNPKLEKITESLTSLEGAMTSANCGEIQTKAKQVIENADPVIEAIEKQELRENNSQLSEVKGKVRAVTNSIRKKCPKGASANANAAPGPAPPNAKCKTLLESKGITDRSSFRTWSLKAHPNKGGDEEEFKEVSSCADGLPTKVETPLPDIGSTWTIDIRQWHQVNGPHGNTKLHGSIEGIIQTIKNDTITVKVNSSKPEASFTESNLPKVGEEITYSLEEWNALKKSKKQEGGKRSSLSRKRRTRKHKQKHKRTSKKSRRQVKRTR